MDPAKASALSRDAATPLATLQELARSDLPFLRENVARHPNVSLELLLNLVPSALESDGDLSVAIAVASNPRTPIAALLGIIELLRPERLDGSHRENWRWENLGVAALSHRNVPEDLAANAIDSLALAKSLRVRVAERRSIDGTERIVEPELRKRPSYHP
jgi:hypothetical protein